MGDIQKHSLEIDFGLCWDAIICAATFLRVDDLFITNYSERLRQPYIDLRNRVHPKHQNFISKFSNFREQHKSVSRRFYFSFTDSFLNVNKHRECVRKTSFEKCCTTQ